MPNKQPDIAAATAKDPVCGMAVNPATARHATSHGGKDFFFCCASCAEKFKANPEKYLDRPAPVPLSGLVTLGMAASPQTKAASPLAPGNAGTVSPAHSQGQIHDYPPESHKHGSAAAYVCPMCPEVRESKPGACPSCGMALEPDSPITARIEYTCPMHPEIVRSEPGSCPICGMALEPRTVSAVEVENPELRDMSRRFWVSLALTAPLLIV